MKWNKNELPDDPDKNIEAKLVKPPFDPSSVIARLVAKQLEQQAAYDEERKTQSDVYALEKLAVYEGFLQYCRPATAVDYAKWVKGYMLNNPNSDRLRYANHNLETPGVIVNFTISDKGITDSPKIDENAIDALPAYKMWVLEDLDHSYIPAAYGANSFNVIVPKGSAITAEDLGGIGHNDFYIMDGFYTNSHWVDLHADVAEVFDRKLV